MHSFAHHHSGEASEASTSAKETRGLVMNMGWSYDLMVRFVDTFLFHGKLQQLRLRTIELAQLQRGDAVLDVGCGTGTLALLAKERVGATGRVSGIDPGPQQIARARSKAARRDLSIDFQIGVIEQLPFPDQSCDVVLSTLMMHHLPDDLKRRGLAEIARVLKPQGRLVIVDFKRSEGHAHQGQPTRLGAGEIGFQDLPALVQEMGFSQIDSGDVQFPRFMGIPGAGFVRARTSQS
jgi:ubiquinone/menaquinone biosynthesis C-methylase UbiE